MLKNDDSFTFKVQTFFTTFSFNRHGSKCAGVIASVANNQLCSVGIAFNATIGGESIELRNWTMSYGLEKS